MNLRIQIRRATLAQLDAASDDKHLLQAEPYWITDKGWLAIGVDAENYTIVGRANVWYDGFLGASGTHTNTAGVSIPNSGVYSLQIVMELTRTSNNVVLSAQIQADMSIYAHTQTHIYVSDVSIVRFSGVKISGVSINPVVTDMLQGEIVIEPVMHETHNYWLGYFRIRNNTNVYGGLDVGDIELRYTYIINEHNMQRTI